MDIHYFAYGSNLCFERLKARVPSVRALGAALLRGHELRWHKKGVDGSAKLSIVRAGQTGGDQAGYTNGEAAVHGALFVFPKVEKPQLDRAEGPGYKSLAVSVESDQGVVTAHTYMAHPSVIDDTRRPYSWYKALVVTGAVSQGLPSEHVEALRLVDAVDDPDLERRRIHRAFLPCGEFA